MTVTNVENSVKTVYSYDEDGWFSDTHIAQVNPRAPGQWLMPARVTTVKPALTPKVFYKIQNVNDINSGWDSIPYPVSAVDFSGIEIPHQSRTLHNQILRTLLREFVKNESKKFREKSINNEAGELIAITVEAIPEPTAAELKAQKASASRSTRDYYLSLTDHLVAADYPISEEQRTEIKTYRQELRDIPQAENFPEDIVWPEPPAFAKSAHKYWQSEKARAEITTKIKAVEARADLTQSQKDRMAAALNSVVQQDGFPYEITWPIETVVLAEPTE